MTGRPDGAVLFSRYAFPPNALGYCGPDHARTLLEHGAARVADPDLVRLARGFEGAWPYLTLIAHAGGIADPLDRRVVEAYWVGSRLLHRVDAARLGDFLEDRFRPQAGPRWRFVAEAAGSGAVPHHNFHVFAVYPWLGLLRAGHTEQPLHVLERCRVRWGTVLDVDAASEMATVESRGLAWDGADLRLGPLRTERASFAWDGLGFVRDLRPGDTVSLHWDWICDRLSPAAAGRLARFTRLTLHAANRGVAHPAPAEVLA